VLERAGCHWVILLADVPILALAPIFVWCSARSASRVAAEVDHFGLSLLLSITIGW